MQEQRLTSCRNKETLMSHKYLGMSTEENNLLEILLTEIILMGKVKICKIFTCTLVVYKTL
jgi:hypothetical protein